MSNAFRHICTSCVLAAFFQRRGKLTPDHERLLHGLRSNVLTDRIWLQLPLAFLRSDGARKPSGIGRAAPDALLISAQSEQNTKLYRSYVSSGDAPSVTRHRGRSPRQAAFFFRNPEMNFHAAQLASLFLMYGLVARGERGIEPRYHLGSLDSGALLCRAYEAYREMHKPASISFEHAWFLLLALARHDAVSISRCDRCGGLRLRDLLARLRLGCGNCEA